MSEWDAIVDIARFASKPASGAKRETTMKEAVGEFEAYFIGEMLRIGGKTASETGLLDGGHAGRMYQEMFFEEVGRLTAKRGALGLVQSLAGEEVSAHEGDEASEPINAEEFKR